MRTAPAVPRDAREAIRAPFEQTGASWSDAPLMQPLNLLLDLAGEEMRARLLVVQAEGAAESCLRADFTVPIARRHIESGAVEGRYLYDGTVFRAAAADGTPEEVQQIGIEAFASSEGSNDAADTEIAALAWRAALAGGRPDLTLWLGDVSLFAAFVDTLELPQVLAARLRRVAGRPRLLEAELARSGEAAAQGGAELAAMLAGLPEDSAATLIEQVWALAGIEPVAGRSAAEIAARLARKAETAAAPALTPAQCAAIRDFMKVSGDPSTSLGELKSLAGPRSARFQAALANWQARFASLADGIPQERLRFAPVLRHAFDYYDGLTLEVRSESLGPDRPIAVGGRYDGLLARLGGRGGSRAVGCMVRPWRAWAGGAR